VVDYRHKWSLKKIIILDIAASQNCNRQFIVKLFVRISHLRMEDQFFFQLFAGKNFYQSIIKNIF